jgi:hypothetical protein
VTSARPKIVLIFSSIRKTSMPIDSRFANAWPGLMVLNVPSTPTTGGMKPMTGTCMMIS